MKQALLVMAILAIPAALCAQSTESPLRYKGHGYAFFSTGACQHGYLNVGGGGGGEGFLWRGLTINGDIGYYGFPADRSGYAVMTVGPGYHFVDRRSYKKFDPYVSANILGLGVARGGVMAAESIGGGMNYWFKDRIGLQTGVQLQGVGGEGLILFRIGITFR